jgi:hypothetical protein
VTRWWANFAQGVALSSALFIVPGGGARVCAAYVVGIAAGALAVHLWRMEN